jgi:hypothetical protein
MKEDHHLIKLYLGALLKKITADGFEDYVKEIFSKAFAN